MASFEDRMSPSDAVMWDIEKDPVLRSTITAVALLDRAPDWDALVARIEQGTCVVPRLRQRVIVPPMRIGAPRWVTDPDFDLGYHVRRVRCPDPGDLGAVLAVAEPLASTAFDRARPLWEFTLVEGMAGGRAALVQKVHHALTDGVGGIRLAMMLLDLERDAAPPAAPPDVPDPDRTDRLAIAAGALRADVREAARVATRVPLSLAGGALRSLTSPRRAAKDAAAMAQSLGHLLAPIDEPCSPVMRGRGLSRHFRSLDVPLDELRIAGAAAGGTVNDAFLAAVTGGLARYHEHHGAPVDRLRIDMPINLRGDDDPEGGNRFAPARFVLPIGRGDTVERMRVLGGLARAWRAEPALALTDQIAFALDRLPVTVTTAIFSRMLKGVDFVATNIAGPPVPVFIGGAALEREYAFAPPTGAAVNIALLSMADTACIGVVLDRAAVVDPDVFVTSLQDGFDEVRAVARPAVRAG
jgi:WS/DGAT/MGAT family acyltransferase